jgi:hypothetical protein
MRDAASLETTQTITADDHDLTERLIAGAVKGVVLLWCAPALLVAFVLTWTAIIVWRTFLLVEAVVRRMAGFAPLAISGAPGSHLALPQAGAWALLQGHRGLPPANSAR